MGILQDNPWTIPKYGSAKSPSNPCTFLGVPEPVLLRSSHIGITSTFGMRTMYGRCPNAVSLAVPPAPPNYGSSLKISPIYSVNIFCEGDLTAPCFEKYLLIVFGGPEAAAAFPNAGWHADCSPPPNDRPAPAPHRPK